MPELPEVEIVKQSLDKNIKSKIIRKVIVRNRNLRKKIVKNFEIILRNKKISKITRYSKYIIIHLSNNLFCIFHLGMSGTIHLVKKIKKKRITNLSFYNSPHLPIKHNHVELKFDDFDVIYNDPRRFGFFELIKKKKDLFKKINLLGPEPFSSNFNFNYLKNFFYKKEKNIKNFLMDQKFVSGIGNIYANEILYFCKINPNKKAKNLKNKDIIKIIYNSKLVLRKAIKLGGSSIRDFKNTSGTKGTFQNNFKVYQRENLNCLRKNCHGKIKKIDISKRSTFFCNNCQN